MLQKRLVILLVLIFGLVALLACGSQAVTAPPPQTPTAEPAAASVTETIAGPTGMPSTSTPPPEPTSTSRPTDTRLPEPTEMPSPEPTSVPVLTETEGPTDTPETIACDGTLTPAQTEGPFYTPNTPERANLVETGMGGTPLLVTGKVLNQKCQPMAGAMLDFWQTDDNGEYDNVGYRMRGHQFTAENGDYTLETILPSRYPGRTPHIHVKIFAPDGREVLTTQIYFPGISDQIPDGIFRPVLLARDLEPDASGRRHIAFDFIVRE